VPLLSFHTQFELELDEWTRVFEELATTRTHTGAADFTIEEECLLEGLLSRIWQSWCRFCRSTLVESCMGTVTVSGDLVPALPDAISEVHVSKAAMRAKKQQQPFWLGTNTELWKEPTWGDTDGLLDIVLRLYPSNHSTLTGMCTLANVGSAILQAARNACAHDNVETRANLIAQSTAYTTFPVTHPIQSLFWVHTGSSAYLLPHALEALRDAAIYVVL